MELKHKSEWPELIYIAKLKNFGYDKTVILLAIREVENGPKGMEFNRLDALSSDLNGQARVMCNYINEKDKEYQRYLIRTDSNDELFSFVEYLRMDSDKIEEYIKQIRLEFETMPKEDK